MKTPHVVSSPEIAAPGAPVYLVVGDRRFVLTTNMDRAEVSARLIESARGPRGEAFAAAVAANDTREMRRAWRLLGT